MLGMYCMIQESIFLLKGKTEIEKMFFMGRLSYCFVLFAVDLINHLYFIDRI